MADCRSQLPHRDLYPRADLQAQHTSGTQTQGLLGSVNLLGRPPPQHMGTLHKAFALVQVQVIYRQRWWRYAPQACPCCTVTIQLLQQGLRGKGTPAPAAAGEAWAAPPPSSLPESLMTGSLLRAAGLAAAADGTAASLGLTFHIVGCCMVWCGSCFSCNGGSSDGCDEPMCCTSWPLGGCWWR